METVINKVLITAEARFDYESEFGSPLPTADIKRETEEYISVKTVRFDGYYFRVKYYDEVIERMLMLFFYKGERFGCMQMWELSGICPAEDWSEELEEDGQIRRWLKTKVNPKEKGDWVIDLREARRRGEIGQMAVFSLVGLPKEVVDAIYNGTDSQILERISHLQRKGGKWVGYRQFMPRHRTARTKYKRTT